jgi:acyl-CoA synthetase (AMP-forming)/AMP-acid ligase II
MNAIQRFLANAEAHPTKMAIADVDHGTWSFSDVADGASKTQAYLESLGLTNGDAVLIALPPSPVMVSIVSGCLASGITVLFIEPWMPLDRVSDVVSRFTPKAFIATGLGRLWGIRSGPIRAIPNWPHPKRILNQRRAGAVRMATVDADHPAFIVFSSGTTGAPKGVIRTHGYLLTMVDILTQGDEAGFTGPDLAVFPNVAMLHLSTGRGAVVVPMKWTKRGLKPLTPLLRRHRPETMSSSPAFLTAVTDLGLEADFADIRRIAIGGALTDCDRMQTVIRAFPQARILHIYGGSEAEPVATIDAEEALKLSRDKGFFHVLCLGRPIPEIRHRLIDGLLWVAGPNVAGLYAGDASISEGIKMRDADGTLWHNMGDRVMEEDGLLWFRGRANQLPDDFLLEQAVYTHIRSSAAFIHRTSEGRRILHGEKLKSRTDELKSRFPEIDAVIETTIIRDRRHRSRIDRIRSLP